MTVKQIDILNIGLMLLSCVVAYIIPFELFLFSYAVLGPLHYLTEIGWLHKRNYFATGRYDYILLALLCLLLISFSFVFTDVSIESTALVLFLAFASALGMILFDSFIYKFATVGIAFLIGMLFQKVSMFILVFAILMPTIIHVFFFTALFIIQGALKNKSMTGLLSVLVFGLCASSFFVIQPTFDFYHVTAYAKENLVATPFAMLNQILLKLGGVEKPTIDILFTSKAGIAVMRLIAFAYTYHYLNWFSKTSVIKWHEVPKSWLVATALLWVGSVVLYYVDYMLGLEALLLLSMLHVFLEFPLNFRSMQGIGQSIGSLFFQNKTR